jgi:exosortase
LAFSIQGQSARDHLDPSVSREQDEYRGRPETARRRRRGRAARTRASLTNASLIRLEVVTTPCVRSPPLARPRWSRRNCPHTPRVIPRPSRLPREFDLQSFKRTVLLRPLVAEAPLTALPVIPSRDRLPLAATVISFAILFAQPFALLVRDWWTVPENGHGLLLAPVALWLAWQAGIAPTAKPNRTLGLAILFLAVFIRCAAGLAAELFTMRASIVLALAALTIYRYGIRQVLHLWLPFTLLSLSIPLPELVTQAIALPLQFRASRFGAALLKLRNVPVMLSGNVIRLPGQELFVTEACSGLRSLTALISLAVLMSAMFLRSIPARVVLVLLSIPIAILINGIRVFLTGFLVYYVNPSLGKGFMHETEGWLLFLVSLGALALVLMGESIAERHLLAWNRARRGLADA